MYTLNSRDTYFLCGRVTVLDKVTLKLAKLALLLSLMQHGIDYRAMRKS